MSKFYSLKKLYAVVFCLFALQVNGQLTTTITTGTAGTPEYNAGPIYRSAAASAYDASRYSYLYTAAELSAAGINPGDYINSLGWIKNNAATTTGGGIFRIYMKTSAATTYGNATETWANLNAGTTMVYENLNQSVPATMSPNYIVFTFATPFTYTGGSLEISTEWDINQVSGNPTTDKLDWMWSTVTNKIYGTGQTSLANAATLSATTNSISAIDDRRPFIQIGYSPGGPCVSPPDAGTTVSNVANTCPGIAFTLSLNGSTFGSGQTYQWESSTDGVTYTPITGATNASYLATQSQTTYYRAVLTCSALSDFSTPIQVVSNTFLDCYCTSNAMANTNLDIFNVTLGTLNNSSTCTTTGGAGSTQGQYSNYSALTAPDLARGVIYPMSIGIGTCNLATQNNFTKVYIDFNHNGLFTDAGEEVYVTPAAVVGPNTINGSISIPLAAQLGVTRMRVVMQQTAASANITPCGTYTQGETEDYLVNITPIPSCAQPTNLHVLEAGTTTADLDWTPGNTETEWLIEYGVQGFTPGTGLTQTVTGNSATTLTGLTPNTFYQAYIQAVCGSDESFFSLPVSFNTYGFGLYMEADTECGTGFVDISTTGTNNTLADDAEMPFTLPFTFYYQGTLVTTMTIGNNGAAQFGSTTQQVANANTAITPAVVDGVYPLWDDLATAGAGVYTQTIGTAPNRRTIIQWNKKHFSFNTGNDLIFQVIFDEATSEIYYHYENVISGNPSYDNGTTATIGVAGPAQDVQVSFNNTDYLLNNDCAHFYYTDCPKPSALTFSNIVSDEFSVDWATGLSGETEWIVEYGPTGFIPGAGTILDGLTASQEQISGLTPITSYDVYVYAACANGDTSAAVMGTVQTLPLCTDPVGTSAGSDIDSIYGTWNWTQGVLPVTGFNLQYGPTGFDLYAENGTIAPATGINFADTVHDVNLMAGMTYDIYIQAVCGADTSNYVGPFSVTMPLTNDSVCMPEQLLTDGTVYTFTNAGATVSNVAGNLESSIAPPNTGLQTTDGWGNTSVNFSTWFTFVAPATGQVRISGTDAGFNGQIAVYKVTNCAQFSTFVLQAANDNEIDGSSLAPNFTVCGLTPGSTYYLMHDSYSTTATGTYSIKISEIELNAGSTASLIEICTGETVNLYEGITGYEDGGVWSPTIPSIVLVDDSVFASAGLAYQTFQFEYRLTEGCAYDSILANVKVFPPSSAGIDGSLVVCRNEPFNLYEGLNGTVDHNGTWLSPTSAVIPEGNTLGNNFPGQYNYKYIAGNGICPNDTAIVIVSVQNCNYLDLVEASFETFNLYPNPTEGMVYISNTGSGEVFSYEVLDLNGRKVMTKDNAINGSAVTEIDLNNMETGIYMIHVFNGNAEKTFRVVVK